MAGDAVIGALRVVLGLDTAKFEEGFKNAEKSLGSFGASMTKLGAAVGTAAVAAFAFLGHEVSKTLDEIDKLGKTAQKVGLPVEEFTKLGLAAALSDVSMESLSGALGKLSKNMLDTSKGTGEARDKFEALGISVTNSDGTLRSVGAVLADLAGKFENSRDGAAKTATAMALLGKGGKDLIPLLNEGKDSLVEMAHAAEAMGLVIKKDTSEQVQKFNDNMKLLSLAQQGFFNMVVEGVIPALLKLSEQFVGTAKSGELARYAADQLLNVIKEFVVVAYQAIIADNLLGAAFNELYKAVVSFPDIEASREAFNNLKTILDALPASMAAARQEALKLFLVVGTNAKTATTDLATESSKLSDTIRDLQIKTRLLAGDFNALPVGFVEAAKALKLFAQTGDEARVTFASLPANLQALAIAQANFNAAQMTEQTLTPWETYNKKIQQISASLAIATVSQEGFNRAATQAALKLATSYGEVAQSIAGPMADAFKTLATMNKQYATAAKAAAIAEALVNTYLAATKALASGFPPFNYIAAAAVTAAGLINVAKISQTQFAKGGSFTVPGGISGTDNTFVPLSLASGERVDVTPASKSGGGGSTELIIPSIKPKDFFSGETVRELLIAVDQWHKDGGQGMRFAT